MQNTPTIQPGPVNQNAPNAILERGFCPEMAIAAVLAHSLVFFTRLEWEPVCDAQCFSGSESSAQQTTTQQQVAAETGTTSGEVTIAGAGSKSSGSGNSGNVTTGKNSSVTIESSDSQTDQEAIAASLAQEEAAVAGNTNVSQEAIAANADVTGESLSYAAAVAGGSDAVADDAIAQAAANQENNDNFALDSLQSAYQAQAVQADALQDESAEYATGLSQDTANAQIAANDANTGNSQLLNNGELPTAAEQRGSLSTLSTWIAIIAGVLAIYFYLRKGKA